MSRTEEKNKMVNTEEETNAPITEAQIQENIMNNTNFIMWLFGIKSRKELADMTDVGAPQITRIMNGEQTPSVFPFLVRMKEKFHYSIDELLFKDLRKEYEIVHGTTENIPVANYMMFEGIYQIYYYDTSSFKGRERTDDVDALRSGLMLIKKDPKSDKGYRVVAIFNMKKEYADSCYEVAMKKYGKKALDNLWNYMVSLNTSNHVYFGEFELSAKNVHIWLRFENTKDRVQMIFHRPESNSNKYIGGLGAMVSVSKGRKSEPCVQYVAISEDSLNVSEEEIASHLLMHYPSLKTYDASNELTRMLIQLYQNDEGRESRLTDEQKKMLVRNHVDKIVNETVEKNLFRKVVVSDVDDDEFYHYLKRAKSNAR